MTRLDTNYILRYLLNDNEKMAVLAEKIILHEDVYIANEVWAEVIYVLEGVYGLEKPEISAALLSLVQANNIQVADKYTLMKSFSIFAEKKLDFVDCLLCAYSGIDKVLTFDKKLNKCIDGQKK